METGECERSGTERKEGRGKKKTVVIKKKKNERNQEIVALKRIGQEKKI
jgi:hypothetical protein